jgi:predicted negative regulator of RcsB-dependent stress response
MAEEYLTDDEQLEAAKRMLKEYAPWLITGAVLGIGGYYGYQYYENHKTQQSMKAAADYAAIGQLLAKDDRSKAASSAEALMSTYPSTPYADHADLLMARVHVDAGELANAVERLNRVMTESKDKDLQTIARLRLARVYIDQKKPDAAIALLAMPTDPAFVARAHEIRGDALLAKQDNAGAIKEYSAALTDADGRGIERGFIELKIADLGGKPPAQVARKPGQI